MAAAPACASRYPGIKRHEHETSDRRGRCRFCRRPVARHGQARLQRRPGARRHCRRGRRGSVRPSHAIVDLKLPGDSGLKVVSQLAARTPAPAIVVLTGYASIATAVAAVRLGARHYLAKPADADEILAALLRDRPDDAALEVSPEPLSVARLEWEHIQKVLNEHDGNISATARALKMHRRTLQRKLDKRPPRAD